MSPRLGTKLHFDWGPLAAVVLLAFFLTYTNYASRKVTRDGLHASCLNANVRTKALMDNALAHYVKDETNASDLGAPPRVRSASQTAADSDLSEVKMLHRTLTNCATRWPEPSYFVVTY